MVALLRLVLSGVFIQTRRLEAKLKDEMEIERIGLLEERCELRIMLLDAY